MPQVSELIDWLEKFAPLATAAEWDNVGLLLGERSANAERVMTCLTITPEVVAEAVEKRVGLIVSHHPVLFRGAKKLSGDTPEGRLLIPLLREGIAVYSPHTAFDNCPGGINDTLAGLFGLKDVKPLRNKDAAAECKLVVFVPDADLEKVSQAIFLAGGGRIGLYEQCSFRIPGTGTFFGTDATNPTIGTKGRREEVTEQRLEVIVPTSKLDLVLAAMRAAHSYEEPAYDVYPLKPNRSGGEGRIGILPQSISLRDFADKVKKSCKAAAAPFVGVPEKMVRTVAIACGAAGEFLNDAIRAKADVFVTGEMRFHDYLAAEAAGISLVLPGHYASERPGVEALATRMKGHFPDCDIWASRTERDPLSYGERL